MALQDADIRNLLPLFFLPVRTPSASRLPLVLPGGLALLLRLPPAKPSYNPFPN